MSKDITIGGHFEQIVEREIAAGHFGSPREVVEAALSLLDRDQTKVAALRAAIDEGDASGIAEDSSLEGILAEIRAQRSR